MSVVINMANELTYQVAFSDWMCVMKQHWHNLYFIMTFLLPKAYKLAWVSVLPLINGYQGLFPWQ